MEVRRGAAKQRQHRGIKGHPLPPQVRDWLLSSTSWSGRGFCGNVVKPGEMHRA